MKIKTDSVDLIFDDTNYGAVVFDVCITWYLYPQVFIKNKDLLAIPSVRQDDGYCYPLSPTQLQKEWIKSFFFYPIFKKKVLIPYFANLRHYQITGRFVNGGQGLGVNSLKLSQQ